jgi:hypothetical protein
MLLVAIGIGAAGLIAASVAVVLLVGGRAEPETHPEATVVAAGAPSIRLAAGSAEVGGNAWTEPGRRIGRGEPITAGDEGALFSMDGRIALLARAGSRMRVRTDADRYNVDLDDGALIANVDPAAHAPGLTVTTPAGRVEVTGTVFAVFSGSTGSIVELFRGSVDVGAGSVRTQLGAGESIEMGGDRLPIDPGRVDRVLAGAEGILAIVQGRGSAPLEIGALDGLFEHPGSAPGEVGTAAPVAGTGTAEGRPRSGPQPTARQLLAAARAARKEHDWAGAAQGYRDLVQRFPNAGEAGVALVDLGSIELDRLGQPDAALASFDRYLRANAAGSLAAEASWGRAKTLRALGRAQEERAALAAFVASFPEAFQAVEARRRLYQLE